MASKEDTQAAEQPEVETSHDDAPSEPMKDDPEAPSTAQQSVSAAATGTRSSGPSSRRRAPGSASPVMDVVTQASLSQAASLCGQLGYQGLSGLLLSNLQQPGGGKLTASAAAAAAANSSSLATATTSLSPTASGGSDAAGAGSSSASLGGAIPSKEAVRIAAQKAISEDPPWVHWKKSDMAPQLKTDARRLLIQGALRGYRMARASHGVNRGCYYFECWILPGPSSKEILSQLPSNARLGPGLEEQLRKAVAWEEKQPKKQQSPELQENKADTSNESPSTGRKRKHAATEEDEAPPKVGGHLRIGWSMRTGDLQAPVGYDKWSYGIRNINGSIIHKSERQDSWGGDDFDEGDILGCAICLYDEEDADSNQIRFFKNGECLGTFVIAKGKREGGEAFTGLESGTYYPAVSSYMGGAVKVNFGPHWVYPPRKLPAGFPKFSPISDLCKPPDEPDAAIAKCSPAIKLFRKVEHQNALKEVIKVESQVLVDAYEQYYRENVEDVRRLRTERGCSVQDLPSPNDEEQATEP